MALEQKGELVKAAAIRIAKAGLNLAYRARRRNQRRDEAVFLSRQTNTPSYDFEQLARALRARGWQVTMHLKKVSARNFPAYVMHVWKEIGLLGRCRVAILDRYDPVVSLIDFECEPASGALGSGGAAGASGSLGAGGAASASGASGEGGAATPPVSKALASAPANTDFPAKPIIVELWHAFGAFKKFGFQSNDTPEGHTTAFMKRWQIHRNYTWVVCSGEACRPAYAEAFSCPVERVVVFDRPERDEIAALAAKRAQERGDANGAHGEIKILLAPTRRIDDTSQHPFRDLYEHRVEFEERVERAASAYAEPEGPAERATTVYAEPEERVVRAASDCAKTQFTWAFHPLDSGLPAPGNVSDALVATDFVVTDYSSIAYEAYLLGVPVVFYMPDLDEYRISPGLNADPAVLSPTICTYSEDELVALLARLAADPASYPDDALHAFAASAFDDPDPDPAFAGTTAAERLAKFLTRT